MVILITQYYLCKDLSRQNEINDTLIKNVQNSLIDEIYLLNDDIYDIDFCIKQIHLESKIKQIKLYNSGEIMKYSDAILFANEKLDGKICIISNNDIIFDNTLKYLSDYDLTNKFLALSRYDNNVLYDRSDSQDSWIFLSPANVSTEECKFTLGKPGCDNRIAKIFSDHNYLVINPSKTIVTHHNHASKIRYYSVNDRIKGKYLRISPDYLP